MDTWWSALHGSTSKTISSETPPLGPWCNVYQPYRRVQCSQRLKSVKVIIVSKYLIIFKVNNTEIVASSIELTIFEAHFDFDIYIIRTICIIRV